MGGSSKGFSSTEEKTMLLIEGGVLTFDDDGLVDITGDYPTLIAEAFGSEEGEGRKLRFAQHGWWGAPNTRSPATLNHWWGNRNTY